MAWFRKHLNLTLVIVWLGYPLVIMLPLAAFSGIFILMMVGWAVYYTIAISTTTWVIEKKGRSLGYLFLVFTSLVGLIVILCLKNKAE